MPRDGGDDGSQGAGRENGGGHSENGALKLLGPVQSCHSVPRGRYLPACLSASRQGWELGAPGSGPTSTSSIPQTTTVASGWGSTSLFGLRFPFFKTRTSAQ